ncbi:MAG: acyltransferase [Clostridia bacterium]|nr:acyltransferase [Clostridia bacterium]
MRIFDTLWNRLLFAYYKVSVGKNFVCDGRLVIQGKGRYQIGNDVHIISKEFLNPVGGNRTVLQTLDGGTIEIGDHVGMSHAILCAREKIRIEDNVLIGGGVKIFDNDFHSVEYEYRMEKKDTHIRKGEIVIKEGAFIGAHSIILKKVVIGRRAVVGAGSVVTKSIPDGEVWAGNPAKFVRMAE